MVLWHQISHFLKRLVITQPLWKAATTHSFNSVSHELAEWGLLHSMQIDTITVLVPSNLYPRLPQHSGTWQSDSSLEHAYGHANLITMVQIRTIQWILPYNSRCAYRSQQKSACIGRLVQMHIQADGGVNYYAAFYSLLTLF